MNRRNFLMGSAAAVALSTVPAQMLTAGADVQKMRVMMTFDEGTKWHAIGWSKELGLFVAANPTVYTSSDHGTWEKS